MNGCRFARLVLAVAFALVTVSCDRDPLCGEAGGAAEVPAVRVPGQQAVDVSPAPPVLQRVPHPAAAGYSYVIYAKSADPQGFPVSIKVDWGDGLLGPWSEFVASEVWVRLEHVYNDAGSYDLRMQARNNVEEYSAWSGPAGVQVREGGVVLWCWVSPDEDSGNPIGSPVIAMDNGRELAYDGAEDYYGKFYGVSVLDGITRRRGSANEPEEYFTGHPAFCASTGHIIAGCEDGELYGFTTSLSKSWNWPDSTGPTNIEWFVTAVRGTKLYATRNDDRLYYLTDVGGSVTRNASVSVPGIRGGPVITPAGDVIYTHGRGWVSCRNRNLDTLRWTRQLGDGSDSALFPALGAGGVSYVGTKAGLVCCLSAGGEPGWTARLDGACNAPAVGAEGVFCATRTGCVYRLDPATGAFAWGVRLTAGEGFNDCPVLATEGVMYVRDSRDRLYCLRRSDGSVVWVCNCEEAAPARRRDTRNPPYSPAITSAGVLIIPGNDALYAVAGYPGAVLDASAPWPKWQHDAYNSGLGEGAFSVPSR